MARSTTTAPCATGWAARGYGFRSHSDTEVLLALYAEQGEGMLAHLRGMFAFALWDAEERCLFLARDAYGIKPLYYADDGRTLRLASQVQALRAGGAVDTAADVAVPAGFYLFGTVPEPLTAMRTVRALPAGSWLPVRDRGVEGPTALAWAERCLAGGGNGVRAGIYRWRRGRVAIAEGL